MKPPTKAQMNTNSKLTQPALSNGAAAIIFSTGQVRRWVGFNYNYREYISTNWQVIAEAVYEHYSNDIQDSPIARHDFESEIGFGLIYVF